MDLGPGSEFAAYRIESVLGRGGMGVVYVAEDLGLKRRVALKVLASDLAADERFRNRFVRESQLAASLEHPNIVPIHEAGEVEGVLYIAMRYVEGTDLRALLRAEGALEPGRATAILIQLASALDAAHARGLVHRDVKPANVLLATRSEGDETEHVYLSDFGLTKRTTSDSGITATGQFVGTLDYAAPEQFQGKPLDARTDVYSLGCLFYECLAGHTPFPRESDAALMYAHLMEPPPPLSSQRREIPESIDPIVARATAKKPADRYDSAGAFAAEVRKVLAPAGGLGVAGSARRRSSWALAAVGAAGVIVVAIVLATTLGREPASSPAGRTSPSSAIEGPPLGTLVEIDPSTGRTIETVADLHLNLAGGAIKPAIAVGEGGVWVMDSVVVRHIDPGSRSIEASIPYQAQGQPGLVPKVDVGLGDVVLTDAGGTEGTLASRGALSRIDPATNQLRTVGFASVGLPTDLAIGARAIWETFGGATLLRIDPRTFRVRDRLDLGGSLDAVAVGADSLWLGDTLASTVRQLDPSTGRVSDPIHVTGNVDALAAEGDRVWVLDRSTGTVTPIDASSGLGRSVRVGEDPTDIVSGLGAIWISDGGGAVWRVDPLTEETTEIDVGSPLAGLAVDPAHGTLWVLVAEH